MKPKTESNPQGRLFYSREASVLSLDKKALLWMIGMLASLSYGKFFDFSVHEEQRNYRLSLDSSKNNHDTHLEQIWDQLISGIKKATCGRIDSPTAWKGEPIRLWNVTHCGESLELLGADDQKNIYAPFEHCFAKDILNKTGINSLKNDCPDNQNPGLLLIAIAPAILLILLVAGTVLYLTKCTPKRAGYDELKSDAELELKSRSNSF